MLPSNRDAPLPPRYKMVVVTWLAIYPLITATFFFLGAAMLRLPLGFRTLVVTALIVPAMFYLVMPVMSRLFSRWLYPKESREARGRDAEQ